MNVHNIYGMFGRLSDILCRQVGKHTSRAVTSFPAVREVNDRASVDATWQCVLTMDNGVATPPPRYARAVNFV